MSDGPDVEPGEVGGGEGVELCGGEHQHRLLVPDPVQLSEKLYIWIYSCVYIIIESELLK